MDAWIDRLAAALEEDPLTEAETTRLLGSARDVAHRVERRITPLAAFLLGSATGRGLAGGASRDAALASAIETLEGLLPDEASVDDVLQETWLRLSRSDAGSVENMRAWLTTVVARLSLDELRARGRLVHAARAHRPRRPQAQGDHLPPGGHEE